MTEEEAKLILQDMFSDEEVDKHMERIRRLGGGYWVQPEAEKYVEELLKLP